MKRIFLLLVVASQGMLLFGQQAQPKVNTAPKASLTVTQHTTADSLRRAFEHGHFNGSFRTYFMATDNARNLSDYYALAGGGGLRFNSAPWHGLSFGIGGMFIYNFTSSNLSAKDSITGASSRYEIGLFDVTDPGNRNDLARIQELWLRYQWKKSRITVGQQSVQTPVINEQDGRMLPTAEAGVWTEMNELKDTKIEGGWLWKISPRSTVGWYGIGESVGLYPKGLNLDGTGSGYPRNLESAGVGVLGITRYLGKRTKIQIWDHYVENIFNNALVQADFTFVLKKGHKLLLGAQLTRLDAIAHGGNADASKTYIQKGGKSNVISTQAGWQRYNWQVLIAYTRITADGRFLSPREWGREPFYTSMPRERIEGSGNTHAITGRLNWQNKNKKIRIEAAYGQTYLPDVKKAALNKYAIPSFNQFNFDVRYAFGGIFEGFRVQFLYVRKGRLGEVYNNDKFVINKVDMSHYNLILNFTY